MTERKAFFDCKNLPQTQKLSFSKLKDLIFTLWFQNKKKKWFSWLVCDVCQCVVPSLVGIPVQTLFKSDYDVICWSHEYEMILVYP